MFISNFITHIYNRSFDEIFLLIQSNLHTDEHNYNSEFITELYKAHFDDVCVFVKSALYSKNYDDVTSCVQEVFLVAMKKKDLENHPNLLGFLFLTSKNIAKTFNRKYLRETKYICTINERDYTDDFTDFITDKLDIEACREKILNSLSAKEREFYVLYYVNDLSPEEVAGILKISTSAVYIRKHRLYKKLVKIINPEAKSE